MCEHLKELPVAQRPGPNTILRFTVNFLLFHLVQVAAECLEGWITTKAKGLCFERNELDTNKARTKGEEKTFPLGVCCSGISSSGYNRFGQQGLQVLCVEGEDGNSLGCT